MLSPAGLINSSSICWFNAVFQLLVTCAPLMSLLRISRQDDVFCRAFCEAAAKTDADRAAPVLAQLMRQEDKSSGLVMGASCADEALNCVLNMFGPEAAALCEVETEIMLRCRACRDRRFFSDRTLVTRNAPAEPQRLRSWIAARCEVVSRPCPNDECDGDIAMRAEKVGRVGPVLFLHFQAPAAAPLIIYTGSIDQSGVPRSDPYILVAAIEWIPGLEQGAAGPERGAPGHYKAVALRSENGQELRWWSLNDSIVAPASRPVNCFIAAYQVAPAGPESLAAGPSASSSKP